MMRTSKLSRILCTLLIFISVGNLHYAYSADPGTGAPPDAPVVAPIVPPDAGEDSPKKYSDVCKKCDSKTKGQPSQFKHACSSYQLTLAAMSLNILLLGLSSVTALACTAACIHIENPAYQLNCKVSATTTSASSILATAMLFGISQKFIEKKDAWGYASPIVDVLLGVKAAIGLVNTAKNPNAPLDKKSACTSSATSILSVQWKAISISKNVKMLKEQCELMKTLNTAELLNPKAELLSYLPLLINSAFAESAHHLSDSKADPTANPMATPHSTPAISPGKTIEDYFNKKIPLPVEDKPFTDFIDEINQNSDVMSYLNHLNLSADQIIDRVIKDNGVINLLAEVVPLSDNDKKFLTDYTEVGLQYLASHPAETTANDHHLVHPPTHSTAHHDIHSSESPLHLPSSLPSHSPVPDTTGTPYPTDIWHSTTSKNIFQIISRSIERTAHKLLDEPKAAPAK